MPRKEERKNMAGELQKRLRRTAAVLLVGAAAAGVFAHSALSQSGSLSDKIDKQKAKLKEIEKEINRHRTKSKELTREEANVLKHLSSLEKEIALAKKYVGGLEEREALLEQQIEGLRQSVAYEGEVLVVQQRRLAKRLREMYKRGPTYRWDIILGSRNIEDALQRSKFLGLLAERDAKLVEDVKARKLGFEHEQAVLTEALADIAMLKATRLEENQRMESAKKERVAVLNRVRNEKSKHAQAIAELEKAQEELKGVIDALEQKRLRGDDIAGLPSIDFAGLKGKLIKPVEGRITKGFGQDRHPKFGTVTFNNGVNIQAPRGTPIRAVAPARVEFVDWIAGYGNCIILNHGGGYYTLYAHASEIFVRPGQSVTAQEVIAEVGDSGSLNGYECHFEIRKSKQALNPMEWFRQR